MTPGLCDSVFPEVISMNCKPQTALSQWLIRHLPLLIFILCVSQPLLDVLSYWVYYFELPNTLTLFLRLLMLAGIVLTGFILSRKKIVYYILAGILLALTAGHVWACHQVGYTQMIGDLTNLVRIYQFPFATVCFITFLRAEPRTYTALRHGIFASLCIIALVELLSLVTGTDPHTYANKSLGLLGWFYFANSQSAILSCIVPISLAWCVEKWRDRPVYLLVACLGCLGILYFLGTRLSYLALFAAGVGLAITLLIVDRTRKRSILILLLCTCCFIAAFPLSPMYRNQTLVAENAIKKQELIDSLVAEDEAEAVKAGLTGEALELARLEGAYEHYLGGLVHRYGLRRVAERYDYSDRASDLADVRRMRISYCALMQEDLPLSAKLFGMELGDLTYEDYIYDVENDLHGIYYLTGAAGLCMLLAFLAWFVFLILRALIQDFKRQFTVQAAGWGIALLTSLTHIYATAGVLRRPNVSIYLSITLACILHLTRKNATPSMLPESK